MFVFPLGLESKFKIIPIATLVIGFITIIYSLNNFSLLSDFEKTSHQSSLSKAYAKNIKNYVYKSCVKDKKNFCNDISKLPNKVFVRILNNDFYKKDFKSKKVYSLAYIQAKIKPEALKSGSSEIYKQHLQLKHSIQKYIKSKQLLNKDNINIVSLVKSLLLHSGFLHLVGNMLLFLFLAPYVEARVGIVALFASYLLTGVVGSGLDVLLNQDLKL